MQLAPSIPAVYMRGGTSKGVFLHATDLPPAGAARDELLLQIMGSPDPLQIDGMGGTFSSTSKVMVVEPPRDGVVQYWFAQIGVDRPIVDWTGNCGNLTTAIAPFAIDEGLVPANSDLTRVSLVNGNTGVKIEAEVHTPEGHAATMGDHKVAGVPGGGSPVVTRYLDPAGGVLGELLPMKSEKTEIVTPFGSVVASLVDAAHPYLFVRASDVGVEGHAKSVAELNADVNLLDRVEQIRAGAAVLVGRAKDLAEATAHTPVIPRIMLVGTSDPAEGLQSDLTVTAFSMGQVHRGLPMTGALCLAAAAVIEGTLVTEIIGDTVERVRIRHPLGMTEVVSEVQPGPRPIRSLGVVRTARRLMDGRLYPRQYG